MTHRNIRARFDCIRTEIGDAWTLVLDLVRDKENGADCGGERLRHHLIVEHLRRERRGDGAPN